MRILTLAALLVLTSCSHGERSQSASAPSTSLSAPPPTGADPSVSLRLSQTEIPSSGAVLTAVISSVDGMPTVVFGVRGRIDRWDGERWAAARMVVASWLSADSPGAIFPISGGPSITIPSIGFRAVAGQAVSLYVRIDGLEPGWYQLCLDTGCASFRVLA
jgi:hypothetical protein